MAAARVKKAIAAAEPPAATDPAKGASHDLTPRLDDKTLLTNWGVDHLHLDRRC